MLRGQSCNGESYSALQEELVSPCSDSETKLVGEEGLTNEEANSSHDDEADTDGLAEAEELGPVGCRGSMLAMESSDSHRQGWRRQRKRAGVRLVQRLMNWIPLLVNSEGTSRIS